MLEDSHLGMNVRLFQIYLLLKLHLRISSSLQISFCHIADCGFQFVTLEEINSRDSDNSVGGLGLCSISDFYVTSI